MMPPGHVFWFKSKQSWPDVISQDAVAQHLKPKAQNSETGLPQENVLGMHASVAVVVPHALSWASVQHVSPTAQIPSVGELQTAWSNTHTPPAAEHDGVLQH